RPPRPSLFPYTTLFRSLAVAPGAGADRRSRGFRGARTFTEFLGASIRGISPSDVGCWRRAVLFTGQQGLQRGHDDQQDDWTNEHAADHYGGERTLHLAADSGRNRRRQPAHA